MNHSGLLHLLSNKENIPLFKKFVDGAIFLACKCLKAKLFVKDLRTQFCVILHFYVIQQYFMWVIATHCQDLGLPLCVRSNPAHTNWGYKSATKRCSLPDISINDSSRAQPLYNSAPIEQKGPCRDKAYYFSITVNRRGIHLVIDFIYHGFFFFFF